MFRTWLSYQVRNSAYAEMMCFAILRNKYLFRLILLTSWSKRWYKLNKLSRLLLKNYCRYLEGLKRVNVLMLAVKWPKQLPFRRENWDFSRKKLTVNLFPLIRSKSSTVSYSLYFYIYSNIVTEIICFI